ncbi:ornithine cyclodeaminase family protein [Actinopolymorpha singaporensis]
MTLLLGRSDLERVLDVPTCLDALRHGFATVGSGEGGSGEQDISARRVRTDLPGPGTATALMPSLVPGVPAYTVKVNAKFPGARPALRGLVCLHDLGSGELLAVLDSATVTAWRTGLAAALGTHMLARPEVARVGVVGAGAQADLVVRGLSALRTVRGLAVHDVDPDRARAFGEAHVRRGTGDGAAVEVVVAADPAEVARRCGIVVLATWARSPLLSRADVPSGTHLSSLGADEPGKAELTADLLRHARVFVDDVDLAVAAGALGNVGLGPDEAAGTLGEVLTGRVAGRSAPEQVTVYAPVGLPWQDLALSWLAYDAARASGLGTSYDWLA